MSGPKCYTPPPQYSMQVFDGRLNQAFQLQSRLKMLCSEIASLQISDMELSIYFDCKHELGKLNKKIDDALKALVFDYNGTFGQEVYNRVSSEVDLKISTLQRQLESCESIKTEFMNKRADYESYQSYLLFYDNSQISFNDFKSQIVFYLKNNIETSLPDVFNKAKGRINSVNIDKKKAVFEFGFNAKFDSEKQAVVNHITQKENEVNRIRAEVSDEVLDKLQAANITHNPIDRATITFSEATVAVIEKVKSLIKRCDDAVSKRIYADKLQRLTDSESLKDIYFFKELHDSIYESEQTRKARNGIGKLLNALNETTLHQTIQNERQSLIRLCVDSLNRSNPSKNDFDILSLRFEQLKKRSTGYFEEELIKQKEHLFLKSQIVLCLENLGYEVMDDLEVIDFEKEDDFLLKIHDQENYLNLKFKEDGSMRYVFQITEDRSELSTDQQNSKLHEMEITLESLVTVPNNKRDKLKAKSKTNRQKHQIRGKYLTSGGN